MFASPVTRGFDNCAWNGLVIVYRPPMDYTGLEYNQTGYAPAEFNTVANSVQLTFKVQFDFKGRMPYTASGYNSTRSYNNVRNQNITQYSYVPGQNQPG